MFLLTRKILQFLAVTLVLFSTVESAYPPSLKHCSKRSGDYFPKPPPKYELSACAIFQSEERFLREWIEFHLLVGVQHFYLFNNLSDDNYRQILMPYVEAGIVELIEWPYSSVGVVDWNEIQCNAYMHAVKTARGKTRWLAILDTDEFLIPVSESNLVNILSKYVKYGGVCVNWQMYGTSEVAKFPTHGLMIESLLLKAPEKYKENIHVKSIVQPLRVSNCTNPHHFSYKKDYFSVNTNKELCPGPFNDSILIDKMRINHYWARDEEFLYNVKIPRNVKWGGRTENILERVNLMNQVYDPVMLRFTEKLRLRMGLPLQEQAIKATPKLEFRSQNSEFRRWNKSDQNKFTMLVFENVLETSNSCLYSEFRILNSRNLQLPT